MKVLFITSSRIGDAILSTGLLDYIIQTYPDARPTIVCGPLAASLFEGVPNLDRVISLKKEKHHKHWLKLWQQVVGTRWDMVIDLRNSIVSRVIRGQEKYIFSNQIDKKEHKVLQNAAVMNLSPPPAPRIFVSAQQAGKAKAFIPDGGRVLGVGPAANWPGKTWPADRFIEVIEYMIGAKGPLSGARVAVFAAPGEEDIARPVLDAVSAAQRIDMIAKCDPGTAASTLARCDFYIGNDSGLMHAAAAAGVPTVGLFGPSYPHLYSPWGAHTSYVSTPESYDELIDYEGYHPDNVTSSLMMSLKTETVISHIENVVKSYDL